MRTLLLIYCLFSLGAAATAQDSTRLTVGVVERIPYAMVDERGNWSGISVELWRRVAEREGISYRLIPVAERDSLLPLVGKQVDVLLQASVTPNGTRTVDYLQPYIHTTLAIAKPRQNSIWQVAKNVFSLQFLQIILSLSVLLVLVGTTIYFLERGSNEEQFGGERSLIQGIGSGFWWAGVTLTTIGYGDKAPTTLWGRIVAMLWMLTALAITASLTAAVVSALDSGSSITFPDDLRGKRVGVTAHTESEKYLEGNVISFQSIEETKAGLKQLTEGEIDLFIASQAALNFALINDKSLTADVQTTNTQPLTLSIAVEKGSPIRDQLDAAVINVILSLSWRQLLEKYGAKDESPSSQ